MDYKVVVFGVKDTTADMVTYIRDNICPVDLVITIDEEVTGRNLVSGYKPLTFLTEAYGIPVHAARDYSLQDDETKRFIAGNSFGIGVVMGWGRLIPKYVLESFSNGIFGFHGNAGYLPFGRGRSPLNWSIILGDTRFNLNLFQYDENADSPNIFATESFEINVHDDIRSAQYKNQIISRRLVKRLLETYRDSGEIKIRRDSKDFDSWYKKRTPADGRIDWHERTRNIYNLIRGVAAPFPGAFCSAVRGAEKEGFTVRIWDAQPFDQMLDLSEYAPGEVVEVFDGRAIVRTVDGSILINRYDTEGSPVTELKSGDILR